MNKDQIVTLRDRWHLSMPVAEVHASRRVWFAGRWANKKVLHVGCADAGIPWDARSNIHAYLSRRVKHLVGMDIDVQAVQAMQVQVPGTYYMSLAAARAESYDVVIVPEVLEHVREEDVFLREVFAIAAREVFITVPSVLADKDCRYDDLSGTSFEVVNPEHVCWHSPHTLFCRLRPFLGNGDDVQFFYLEHRTMIGCAVIRPESTLHTGLKQPILEQSTTEQLAEPNEQG